MFDSLTSLHAPSLKSLRRPLVSSSLNVQLNSPVKPSGPGRFFVERFLIGNSVSLLVIGLFRFLFLHDLVLAGFVFLGIYPFHLVIQFVGIQLLIVLFF